MGFGHRILAGIVAIAVVAAAPAQAGKREVVYEGDSYTVYREDPSYCTLYFDFDFDGGGMVRMSYRGTNGAIFFSLVKNSFPDVPDKNFPASFLFDNPKAREGFPENAEVWVSYPAVRYDLSRWFKDEKRRGFSVDGDMRLLDLWGDSRQVAIRVGASGVYPEDRLDITGGDKAIAALKTCAAPQAT